MATYGTPEYQRLLDLLTTYLRPPTAAVTVGSDVTFEFSPPLSTAEQTTFDRIAKIANATVVGITPAEWLALEDDIAGLVTYQGIATPTLAQTVLAVKAQSRILRALLRS